MTAFYRRYLRSGYTDLGSIQIPPRPQGIVLTDRNDGSLWLLSFSTNPRERLSIVNTYSTIQRSEGVTIYGPYEGPVMDEDGEFQLMLRGGRLGFDYRPFPVGTQAKDNMVPYARISRDQRQLLIDSLNPLVVHIGYNAP